VYRDRAPDGVGPMTDPANITSAADCLRHVIDDITEIGYKMAVLYIEVLVAQETHKAVVKTIEERHQAAMAILSAPFRETPS